MVAVVTGAGLGLVLGSGSVLGSRGQVGSARLGQAGTNVTVNAATGNLVVQSVDDILIGRGPDDVITNTYNSQVASGNGWRESVLRSVGLVSGTVNSDPSTAKHYGADGSEVLYTFYASYGGQANVYVGNESDGAYDTLTFNAGNNKWTWTEGKSRIVEVYDGANNGRLVSTTDSDGNALTYTYNGNGLVSTISTANGETTNFTYVLSNGQYLVNTIYHVAASLTQTRTYYYYDTSNRLTDVKIDLTPADTDAANNTIADNYIYTTSYTYDGTTNRIASIVEREGVGNITSQLNIAYVLVGSAYAVSTLTQMVAAGVTSVTSFSYAAGKTTVTDAQGAVTTFVYDSNKRLTQLTSPAASAGGAPQSQYFSYDANGNLLYSGPTGDPLFSDIETYWADLANTGGVATTQTTEIDGGVRVYRRTTGTATPAAGWVMRLGQSVQGQTPVNPGQTVTVSLYAATAGASQLTIFAQFRDAGGVAVGTALTNVVLNGTLGASGVATAKFATVSGTAPAGTVYVELMVQATADGTGALNVAIAQPTIVVDGGVQVPAYRYTYDANGNRLSQTDIFGNQTLYTYNSNNQLLTKTDYADPATPLTTRYVYDAENHLTYVISPVGEVTRYIYNSYGQQTGVVQYTDPVNDIYSTAVNPADAAMYSWATAAGRSKLVAHRTDMTYDARGALLTSTTYTAENNDTEATGAGTARTTNYVYNSVGQLVKRFLSTPAMTDPNVLPKETFVYDGLGRVLKVTDFNGVLTKTIYDSTTTGARATVTLGDNTTTRTSTYDLAGNLIAYTAWGSDVTAKTIYVYDSNGNLIRTTDLSNPGSATDVSGRSTYFVYDDLNRKVADVAADGTIVVYRYNMSGQVIATIAYANKLSAAQITTLYNATNANASVNLSAVTPTASASDDRWTWTIYDADGRMVQTIDGLGDVTTYAYDGADRLVTTTAYATALAAATVTGFKTFLPAMAVAVSVNATDDRVTRVFYDADSRVVGVLDGDGYLTRTFYDGAGEKIRTLAYATQTNATYRASGTLAQLTSGLGDAASDINNWFLYDDAGMLAASVDGEGYVTTYSRTYTTTTYKDTVTRFGDSPVDPTVAPALTGLPVPTKTEITTSTYDLEGHIKATSRPQLLTGGVAETTTYSYDSVYNLVSQSTGSSTSEAGGADGRTASTRYDSLGRVTGRLDGIGSVALAALGASPTATQIDNVYTTYGTTYSYDTWGRLISQRDPNGNKTLFFYDLDNRLTYQVDATGGVVQYVYTTFSEKSDVLTYVTPVALAGLAGGGDWSLTGLITTDNAKDSKSHTDYDVAGQVVTVIDYQTSTVSGSTFYLYNAFGEVKRQTAPLPASVTVRTDMVYTRRGLLQSSTADVGGLALTTGYLYNAFGQVKQVTDANSSIRTTDYYRTGKIKTQTDALIHSAGFTYDGFGHVVTSSDRTGAVTNYDYTLFDRQITVKDPNNISTVTTNNAYGQTVRTVVDSGSGKLNLTSKYVYDDDGKVISATDALNHVTRYVYDVADRLAYVIDPIGAVTAYTYDNANRVTKTVVYAAFNLTTQTQTLANMTSWVTSNTNAAKDLATYTSYDGKGQVKTTTDANNVVTTYTYDRDGRVLTSVVGGLNLTTTTEYDVAGRVSKVTSPANVVTQYTYDAVGRLTQQAINPAGLNLKTQYEYDPDGNVISKIDAENNKTRCAYDAENRQVYVVDPTGAVIGYTYDNEGRVVQAVQYAATYGTGGNLVAADMNTWAGANGNAALDLVTRSVYDLGGRLVYAIDPAGAVTRCFYDGDGNVTQTIQYSTAFTATGVKWLSDLTTWANTPANNTIKDLYTFSYYDADGRVIYAMDPVCATSGLTAASVTAYTYDSDDRVTQVYRYFTQLTTTGSPPTQPTLATVQALATNASDLVTRTVYDAAGRVAYTIDATNAVTTYSYDGNGQVTQTLQSFVKFPTAQTGPQLLSYMQGWAATPANISTSDLTSRAVYDAAGRLTYSIDATNAVTAYIYNADGRVTQTVQYAVLLPIGQALSTLATWTAANAAGSRTTTASYDAAGRLSYSIDAGSYRTDYLYDKNSRVTQATRYLTATPAQTLVTRYAYDAAGQQAFVIDATNAVTAYSYDTTGRVTRTVQYSTTLATSVTGVRLLSDMQTWAAGNTVAAKDRMTRAVYDDGRLTYTIDPAGAVTASTYDTFGRVTKTVQYATVYGTSEIAAPKPSDMVTWIAGHLDATNDRNTTNYAYDNEGRLTFVTDPQGIVMRQGYDTFGRKNLVWNAYGTADVVITKWVFNGNDQVTTLFAPYTGTDQLVTYASYDTFGRQQTATDGKGYVTNYSYDADGRVKSVATPTGDVAGSLIATTYTDYNAFGDVVKITDPNNNAGYFYYDGLGRQTLQIDTEGYATKTDYDLSGEIKSVRRCFTKVDLTNISATNPPTVTTNNTIDNVTGFTHDGVGRVLTSTNGETKTTSYSYDTFGNRLTMLNAANATVTYTYDTRGLLLTQATPASNVLEVATDPASMIAPATTTTYEYNAFGNRTKMIESKTVGTITTVLRNTIYVYDKIDQLIQQKGDAVTVTSSAGVQTAGVIPTQSFVYDKRGNQIGVKDANGAVTWSYYNLRNDKTAQVDALGALTTWTWDANHNQLSQRIYGTAFTPPTDPAAGGTTPPTPIPDPTSYRETDFTYDKANRQLTSTITSAAVIVTGKGNITDGSWSSSLEALTSSMAYDLNGNVIKQTDANSNSVYTWYDKLGRKTATVDQAGYMTAYTLDAEGNVTSQTQYATALAGPFTAGGTSPTAPTANAADRTTTFTYDHNGQRLSETRTGVDYATVNTYNVATTTNADVTIYFTYNDLGQVLTKQEATGDVTTYLYDNLGRVAKMTTATGAANANTTLTTYDGLGNVLKTIAGYGTSTTETTTYAYGAGGRLTLKTDATGFAIGYYYDANGQVTLASYGRVKSDTTIVAEADLTTYDALGRVISSAKGSWNGTQWVVGDTTTDTFYNTYGDVVARGTNTGRVLAKAQEYSDYDAAGRVWRSNADGGVTKVYGYDDNGNATLVLQSLGTTDLRNVADLTAALAATGTTRIISLYDSRNELVDVKRPAPVNLDGTITSVSDVKVAPNTVTVTQVNYGGGQSSTYHPNILVRLSTQQMTLINGNGDIHTKITCTSSTPSVALDIVRPAGSLDLANEWLTFPASNTTQGYFYTVEVYQNGPGSSTTTLKSPTTYYASGAYTTDVYSNTIGSALQIQGVDPMTTALTLYVRVSGSSGDFTAIPMAALYDSYGAVVAGGFTCDTRAAPFNGMANSSWEIKYLATAGTRVLDAKAGSLTFNAGGTAAAGAFTAVPVFAAVVVPVSGLWQLSTAALPAAYTDSFQTFNAFGDILTQTDANGKTTSFTYNDLGKLTQKAGPQVSVVSETGAVSTTANPTEIYYYDKSGRLVGHRDANSNLTTQILLAGTGYGGAEALVKTQYNPDWGVINNGYDIFGNVLTVIDTIGALTTNTYDGDNRLLTVAHPTRTGTELSFTYGPSQLVDTYVYDGLGHRIKHTNNVLTGQSETTDYDLQGRVSSTVTFGGQTTGYGYTWTAMTATGKVTAGQTNAGAWTLTTTNWGRTSSVTSDYFSKVTTNQDLGGHTTTFSYNLTGQVTHQASTAGQSIDYSYTATGQVAAITDNVSQMKSLYVYDGNGNRTREIYYSLGASPVYAENAAISYDALNRVTEYKDSQTRITYAYDAQGNRRNVISTYTQKGASGTTAYWYKYDVMNRFTVTKGSLVGNAITGGTAISYNPRGERVNTVSADGHTDYYNYTTDGYLYAVNLIPTTGGNIAYRIGRTTDVLGRMRSYVEYKDDGTVLLTRNMTYDGDNRVIDETDVTNGTTDGNATTFTNVIHNDYRALVGSTYTGADQGVLIHSKTDQTRVQGSSTTNNTTEAVYSYAWWAGAKSASMTVTGASTGTSTNTYDVNGYLTQVADTGVKRNVVYQNDIFGQVLTRQESNYSTLAGVYLPGARRSFFYLNSHSIGDVGTDQLASRVDYVQQLADDQANATSVTQSWTYFNTATPVVGLNANFDANYEAYNSTSVDQSGSSYTATGGESLQSVAQNLWGDSSLWYLLADANGLDPSVTLDAGQRLTVPGRTTNVHNNTTTFKPYDPNEAQGNTNATQPQPPVKQHGCGEIGDMIALFVSVVVYVAVLYVTHDPVLAAQASNVSHQVVEIAVGNQSKFSLKELQSARTAAILMQYVPFPDTGSQLLNTAIYAAEASVVHQGTNMAYGLQKKFDWTSVAVAGASGAAVLGAQNWVDGLNIDGTLPKGVPMSEVTARGGWKTGIVLTGAADLLASAATKSLLTGQDFGKSLREALPDAVGGMVGTIGNRVGQWIGVAYEERRASGKVATGRSQASQISHAKSGGVTGPSGESISPAQEILQAVPADDGPQITPSPNGHVTVTNLPLIVGTSLDASDSRPTSDPYDVAVTQETFLSTPDLLRIKGEDKSGYKWDYYTRAGPSGRAGTWQAGDILCSAWTQTCTTLDQWDAEGANRPDTIREVSLQERTGDGLNGFMRTLANGASGGLANNFAALMSSRGAAEYEHNLSMQNALDASYYSKSPIMSAVGTSTGFAASLLVLPAKGALAAKGVLELAAVDNVVLHAEAASGITSAGEAIAQSQLEGLVAHSAEIPAATTPLVDEALLNEIGSLKKMGIRQTSEAGKLANLKINLSAALKDKFVELSKGLTTVKQHYNAMGPVLAGVMDSKTGQIFFGTNKFFTPENLTAALKEAVSVAKKSIVYVKTSGAGTHAEIHALADAMVARPGAALEDFVVRTINSGQLRTRVVEKLGGAVPRCPHCELITDGVKFHPSALRYGRVIMSKLDGH